MSSLAARQPVADSPWFWVYLFGTAALVALALASPKYSARQAQIEREYQGRSRAAQQLNGVSPNLRMSTAQRTIITLQPLFVVLAAATAVAWLVFWLKRLKSSRAAANEVSTANALDHSPGRASNLGQS
jgi:hypothetical protein